MVSHVDVNAQVEDFKAVTLKAMETQDADNLALEERLHKRMARCLAAAVNLESTQDCGGQASDAYCRETCHLTGPASS